MKYQHLTAAYRARLFASLQQLDEKQAGWDKVYQLLNEGQRAAEQAQINELAERFADGQQAVLESLKQTGQFLRWELELISLGLAVGNVSEIYRRLHEHYLLQLRFQRELRSHLKWPVLTMLVASAMVFSGAWFYNYLSLTEALLRLLAVYGCFFLLAKVLRAIPGFYNAGNLPVLLVTTVERFPGVSILAKCSQTYHYLQNLNVCLEGGMNLAQSLKQSARRIPDPRWQQTFMDVYRSVEAGQKLSVALAGSGVLTGVAIGPMDLAGAGPADAQSHLIKSVRLAYAEQLSYWARWLPQLLYASLPLLIVLELALI